MQPHLSDLISDGAEDCKRHVVLTVRCFPLRGALLCRVARHLSPDDAVERFAPLSVRSPSDGRRVSAFIWMAVWYVAVG
jgi:hypothetical protein